MPAPFGVTWIDAERRYNFALYAHHATGVTLLLYDENDAVVPIYQGWLDHLINKPQRVWHRGVTASDAPGARYHAYRVRRIRRAGGRTLTGTGVGRPAEGARPLAAIADGDPPPGPRREPLGQRGDRHPATERL